MTAPSHATTPQVLPLPLLLEDIRNGYLAVPRFQRELVWTDEQRLELFRSVLAGVPIGSILQWRTRVPLPTYPNLGPHPLTPPREGELFYYLLDGHQRLATLYGSLVPLPSPEAAAEEGRGFAAGRQWRIFYDLLEEEFYLGERNRKPEWLPMDVVLDGKALRRFSRQLERHVIETKGVPGIPPEFDADVVDYLSDKVDEVALAFNRYEVPVMPFLTDDLDQAVRTFERINSQGTAMSEVHMVAALTWTADFDFTRRIEAVREPLAERGFGDIDDKMVLQVCKAALDLDVTKAPRRESLSKLREQPALLERAGESLTLAADFLRERCQVRGPGVLPYSYQMVLLADALGDGGAGRAPADGEARRAGGGQLSLLDGETDEPPDEANRFDLLERWFWATTFAEYFAGMNSSRWLRARQHLGQMLRGEASHLPPDIVQPVRAIRRFDMRAARSRALVIQLAAAAPSSDDREFWLTALAEHGKDAVPKLFFSADLRDGDDGEGPENRILCLPRDLRTRRRQLLDSPREVEPSWRRLNLIEEPCLEALEQGDVSRFLKLRRRALLSFEEKRVQAVDLTYETDLDH